MHEEGNTTMKGSVIRSRKDVCYRRKKVLSYLCFGLQVCLTYLREAEGNHSKEEGYNSMKKGSVLSFKYVQRMLEVGREEDFIRKLDSF